MNLPKILFGQCTAHILILALVLLAGFPHVVHADSPDGKSPEQSAVLADASTLDATGLETRPRPVPSEAEPATDMSPTAFLLLGSLGLGIVGGVSVMVLRMGPDR